MTTELRLDEGKAKNYSTMRPATDCLGRSQHPSRAVVVARNAKNPGLWCLFKPQSGKYRRRRVALVAARVLGNGDRAAPASQTEAMQPVAFAFIEAHLALVLSHSDPGSRTLVRAVPATERLSRHPIFSYKTLLADSRIA
jgi:hypothetical protein